MGTCMILSSWSSTSIEDVAQASSSGLRWFQLYICGDKTLSLKLIQRVEQSGFKALVLTIDTPLEGQKLACIRNGFNLPGHLKIANFSDDVIKNSMKSSSQSVAAEFYNSVIDSSLTWDIITWVKSITKLPVIVKGVLTGEDALLAVQHGVDGIMVSNHGARQLDGVLATVSHCIYNNYSCLAMVWKYFIEASNRFARYFTYCIVGYLRGKFFTNFMNQ